VSHAHDPAGQEEEFEQAPWDADGTGTIVVWAVLVAAAALVLPLLLRGWSQSILASHLVR